MRKTNAIIPHSVIVGTVITESMKISPFSVEIT
jgi:hypothetical protein